mgnify:CR=1 FL=1
MLERGREMVSFSYEHLVPIRHYVHQHPELSGQEYQTTAYLKAYLEKLGVRILNSGLKTGLIAEIGSGNQSLPFAQILMPFQFRRTRVLTTKVKTLVSCMPVAMISIRSAY